MNISQEHQNEKVLTLLTHVPEGIEFFGEVDEKESKSYETIIFITLSEEQDSDLSGEDRVDEKCVEFDINLLEVDQSP